MYRRDTQNTNGVYEELVLNCSPDVVLYFDTSSVNIMSSSVLIVGLSSSYAVSSSYTMTASVALNANTSIFSFYSTIFTSSTNWITASFSGTPTQWVDIRQSGSYSFTASNIPAAGISQSADIIIYINNTAAQTSSLTFPSSWINVASTWPTYITSSKNAVIWLKAFDSGVIIGTCNIQL
jgi:hypothetical protein